MNIFDLIHKEIIKRIYSQKLKCGFTGIYCNGIEVYENDIVDFETGKVYPRHNEKYETMIEVE